MKMTAAEIELGSSFLATMHDSNKLTALSFRGMSMAPPSLIGGVAGNLGPVNPNEAMPS
jgi:hypothetical protein